MPPEMNCFNIFPAESGESLFGRIDEGVSS
jgi:hypothetical protein